MNLAKERFINRELSWIAFNNRVLDEASNKAHPLLERVKFLSISSSNLDEFFMVRVAGLKEQIKKGDFSISNDGLTAHEQLKLIGIKTAQLMQRQQNCWLLLKKALSKSDIRIISKNKIDDKTKNWLYSYFLENIFPAVTPIAIDPVQPFPFIPNLGLALILELYNEAQDISLKAIILIPQKIERFIELKNQNGEIRFIPLEDVLELFCEELFPNYRVRQNGLIRVTRDSEIELAEDAEDLMRNFEYVVRKRRLGDVIRLEVNSGIPQRILEFVCDHLSVEKDDVIKLDKILGLSSLSELSKIDKPKLKFSLYNPRFPERINDYQGDCFAAIHAKDIVIHHPYETFDVVVQFLLQAAKDPDVVSIKQTLYRTSEDSPIVKALIEAAESGKAVTALIEIRARFDEEANMRFAKDLEKAGAQVIYGFANLKTHAKVSIVVRREGENLQTYVHFGTGNYHPITAQIYTDLSFFTCDHKLAHDAMLLFNYITGYSEPKSFEKINMAPLSLRKSFMELIQNEINHAKNGGVGNIWIKCNAVVDRDIIDALYKASQEGVKIDLVVRGMCSLKPGIPGLSENIKVKSLVGRFLEHTRIYCFGNGAALPGENAKVFISSADLMPRNLDRRIEVMVPIENPTVHEQILSQVMVANLKDTKQSWILQSDGSYVREKEDKERFSAHEYFMNNPSLSGRGTALSLSKKVKKLWFKRN